MGDGVKSKRSGEVTGNTRNETSYELMLRAELQ